MSILFSVEFYRVILLNNFIEFYSDAYWILILMFTEKRDASLSSRFALLINDYMSAHSKEQRILITEIYEMRSWMRKYIILYTTFVMFTKHAILSTTTNILSISLFSL